MRLSCIEELGCTWGNHKCVGACLYLISAGVCRAEKHSLWVLGIAHPPTHTHTPPRPWRVGAIYHGWADITNDEEPWPTTATVGCMYVTCVYVSHVSSPWCMTTSEWLSYFNHPFAVWEPEGSITSDMAEYVRMCVRDRVSLLYMVYATCFLNQ